ncbi:MAG: hypothetical protein ACXVCP_02800 [Bdellovibrio sp.]
MKKILSFAAVLAVAAPAFADWDDYHGGGYVRGGYYGGYRGGYNNGYGNGYGHDNDAGGAILVSSAALSSGLWLSELSHHNHYKMAIVQGEEAALAVLEGAPASDLFLNAKNAAATVLNIQFGDEQTAALTILEMNQTLADKKLK